MIAGDDLDPIAHQRDDYHGQKTRAILSKRRRRRAKENSHNPRRLSPTSTSARHRKLRCDVYDVTLRDNGRGSGVKPIPAFSMSPGILFYRRH